MTLGCPSCAARNRVDPARLGERVNCGRCHTPIAPPEAPIDIGSAEDFDALARACPVPVVVDFWAGWCGPCVMMAPEFAAAARRGAGAWVAAKVNVDELPALAERFRVRGIPTLVVLGGGQEVRRTSGAMTAEAIERLADARA